VTGLSNGRHTASRGATNVAARDAGRALEQRDAADGAGRADHRHGDAGDGEATVSFGAPAFDGGSAIISYLMTSNPDGRTATGAGSPIR